MTARICTIVASNYVPHARVLADTARATMPGCTVDALLVDSHAHDFPVADGIRWHAPPDIGFAEREVHDRALIYSPTEFSTSLKPRFLRHLLQQSPEPVIYLDPDIAVHGPLEHATELAGLHGYALTPHLLQPLPLDSVGIGEPQILLAGTYNLGFIAVGRGAFDLLDWWDQRMRLHALNAPGLGLMTDQRWMTLAVEYWPPAVIRDPGWNVAYWNAATRDVAGEPGSWTVDGGPLRFFHFSGFDPLRPQLLSHWQGGRPRVLLSERPAIAALCRDYAQRLDRHGAGEAMQQPYGWARLPSALPIDERMRALHRDALIAAAGGADAPPDPFDPEDPTVWLRWLREPDPLVRASARVGRYLARIWDERPDLQAAFPGVWGLDAHGFIDWAHRWGALIDKIPSVAIPTVDDLSAEVPAAPTEAGVNLAGYFTGEFGLGEVARLVATSLDAAAIPCCAVLVDDRNHRREHPFPTGSAAGARYDVNVVCVNADVLPRFDLDFGAAMRRARSTIGFWWWEVEHFPADRFATSLGLVDEVWTGSRFTQEAIRAATTVPVGFVPLPVVAPAPTGIGRAALGLPDGFVFLFIFDFSSGAERKNPLGLIEAFSRAFEPQEGPTLVLKSINGDRHIDCLEAVRLRAAARPDIRVNDGFVAPRMRQALVEQCDCYVSLHRSEGFGLTMAEAMALAKPVIASGYSGNLEYMDEQTSMLVPHSLVPVPSTAAPYPTTARWAEPDLDAAATFMRAVVADPKRAATLGARARASVIRRTPEQSGRAMEQLLAATRQRRRAALADDVPPEPTADEAARLASREGAARVQRWLAEGPQNPWDAASRYGRAGQAARRASLRALRPFTARHREFDDAVAETLTAHCDEMDGLWSHTARRDERLEGIEAALERIEQQQRRDRTDGTA